MRPSVGDTPAAAAPGPRSNDRVVAGVAGGWATRWGVEPTVVRAALGLLTLVGGLGVVLYALLALASAPPENTRTVGGPPAVDRRRELAIGAAVAAVLLAARALGLWPGDEIMAPAAAVAVGVALTWTRLDPATHGLAGQLFARILQVLAGIALLGAGVISLADRTGGLANVGASASAIAVVIGGLAIFVAPALGRLLRALDEERGMRIREDERAAVAAHLHDSVLQSLVLIQRSDDPRRMNTLARRQERELRAW
ncbi:MAG: PspC domain-containing protein, partial [Ilumatobacteraceae bacterium]